MIIRNYKNKQEELKMTKYIVHFRNGGFQIVEAENKQDAMSQIDLSVDIESCWEYEDEMTNLIHTLAGELIDMFPGGVSQDNVVDTATCYVDVELGAINADQLWDEVQRLEGGSK